MDDKKTKKACLQCDGEIKKLEEENGRLKQEILSIKNKYLRALADYANLEKRVACDREESRKNANQVLILKLLGFLDNIDRAEIFIKDNHLKIIKEEFYKLLHQEGLEEIKVLGLEFDPQVSEAIDMVVGEKNNVVVEVLRKGYRFNGRVMRTAQVKVSKKIQNN